MKKRLLVILAMVTAMICAMAIVASADDTTKENSYWEGWVFNFTGTAEEAATLKLYALDMEMSEIDQGVTISVGANDFSAIASQNVLTEEGDSMVELIVSDGKDFAIAQYATAIKATVTVEEASSEDVTFSYEVDSVLTCEEYTGSPEGKPFDSGLWFEFDDPANYEKLSGQSLFGNTITLKAGEKTATGYLFYGDKKREFKSWTKYDDKSVEGLLIKETGNTGKYQTSQAVWLWVPDIVDYSGGKEVKKLAGFADKAAAQAFLDKVNYSLADDAVELIAAAFQYDEMTFKHGGVNTADSSDLALWIALFAIAAVAGGAVALKKN